MTDLLMPAPLPETELAPFLERDRGLVTAFASAQQVSVAESEAIFTELYKFLTLCAEQEASLAPSQVVDEAWHFALRDPGAYARLSAVVGHEIRHVPDHAPALAAYRRSLDAMRRRFGAVDAAIWGRASAARCVGAG